MHLKPSQPKSSQIRQRPLQERALSVDQMADE